MSSQTSVPLAIRYALHPDWEAILQVERASFEAPWTLEEFQRSDRHVFAIYIRGAELAGYLAIGREHKRRIELLCLAINPAFRRLGLGTKAVTWLKKRFCEHHIPPPPIDLAISEVNLGGQLFFKANGFIATEVVRGVFGTGPGEDAYLMQWKDPRSDRRSDNAPDQDAATHIG